MDATQIRNTLRGRGFAHVIGGYDRASYRELAARLGVVVAEEGIALRPGAHAYVAKPGPVPFHTDHPAVDVIGWLCEEQDDVDGASRFLDAKPILDELRDTEREVLRRTTLACPPLKGGPPTEHWPVLKARAGEDALFCSPWLNAVDSNEANQAILNAFRDRLSAAARSATIDLRLSPGEIVFVDNTRMLHGRRALGESSRRRLHRLWIQSAAQLSCALGRRQ